MSAVAEHADPRVVAAADQGDGADVLDVAAGHRAAAAEDAGLAVEDEEGLGRVDGEPVVRRAWLGRVQVVARRGGADLAEAVAVLDGRQHRERQIEHRPAERATASGCRVLTTMPVARGQVTGGGEAALSLDVDQAGAAGAEGRAVRVLAELGQGDAEAVHGVQHGGALAGPRCPSRLCGV